MSVQPSGVASKLTVPTWMHRETDPSAGVELALSLAGGPAAVKKMDTTTRIHALRCLSALTIYACQAIQGPESIPPPGTLLGAEEMPKMVALGNLEGSLYPSPEARYVASTLGRSMILIPDRGARQVYACVTKDGDPAQLDSQAFEDRDAGFPPLLLAGVVIAGVVACCVAAVYIAETVCNAINVDRKMEREADTARMISAQAAVLKIVSEHMERERLAGKSLPWDPVELRVIDSLNGIQHDIVTRERSSWPTPFPGATDALGRAGASVAGSLTTVALVLGAAFVLSR
jgi:hypothetical protein